MNTKKAIDILEDFISDFTAEGNNNMVEEFEQIIFLLQRGKAYEAIWEEFRDNRPRRIGTYWEKYINKLEQKYFPKEIIEEVVKSITEQIKEGAEIAKEEAKTDEAKMD